MEAGLEHLPGDRRGRGAAGAVFDEQHADRDPRVQRRARRPRTRRRCCSLRFRRPGSLRCASALARSLPRLAPRLGVQASSVRRCRSCRRPSRRGSRRRCRCPSRTTPIIRWRTVRATDGAAAPRDEPRGRAGQERRARAPAAVGDRRRDGRHLQRRRQHLRPGRSRSSRCRVRPGSAQAGGSVLSGAPAMPGVVVEAEPFGRRRRAARRRA